MHSFKTDAGPFGMPKQVFLAHFEPVGPRIITKCRENGPYLHTYIFVYRHSHSHNHLSCRLLELSGNSHPNVVAALLDPVGPRAA